MKGNALYLISSIVALVVAAICAYLSDVKWLPLVFLALSVAGFGTWLFLEAKRLKVFLSKRTTMYGLNAAFMCLVALCIVTVVNLIFVEHDWKKDFTKNRVHTLSEQSEKVLKGLTKDVTLKAFVNPQQQGEYQKVFDKYSDLSKKFVAEFVDVDRNPGVVKRYGIKTPGTLVFETADRQVKVDNIYSADDAKIEEKITNAIISVTKGDKKTLCFTTGHGEKLLGEAQREGFSEVKESLENGRFKTEELLLVDKGEVPANCEIVFIAGPRSEFVELETKALSAYLSRGGSVLLLLEPGGSPALKGWLAKYGVDWKPEMTVLETNRMQQHVGGNPLAPVVTSYDASHEITKDLKQITIFVEATPVEKAAKTPEGETITSLLSTSARSYELPVKALAAAGKDGRLAVDESKLKKGPISLAVAVTGKAENGKKVEGADATAPPAEGDKDKTGPQFRLVAFGDSDFATNQRLRLGLNADLFQNAVGWLAKEEDLIAIRPKGTDSSDLQITETRARTIIVASVFLAPLLFWVLGFWVWWTRKRL